MMRLRRPPRPSPSAALPRSRVKPTPKARFAERLCKLVIGHGYLPGGTGQMIPRLALGLYQPIADWPECCTDLANAGAAYSHFGTGFDVPTDHPGWSLVVDRPMRGQQPARPERLKLVFVPISRGNVELWADWLSEGFGLTSVERQLIVEKLYQTCRLIGFSFPAFLGQDHFMHKETPSKFSGSLPSMMINAFVVDVPAN
jgi:hypothetical protein